MTKAMIKFIISTIFLVVALLGIASAEFSIVSNVSVNDIAPPTIAVNSPTEGQDWIFLNVWFYINVTDNAEVSAIWYSENEGITNTTFDGNEFVTHGEGGFSVRFWANDTSGNENSSDLISFTVMVGDDVAGPGVEEVVEVSDYLCNKTWQYILEFNKTVIHIPDLIDDIFDETGRYEDWQILRIYIMDWERLCAKPKIEEKPFVFPYWILIIIVFGGLMIFLLGHHKKKKAFFLMLLLDKAKKKLKLPYFSNYKP